MSELEFVYPLMFLCLPLPLLVYYFFPAHKTSQTAARVPFFGLLMDAFGTQANSQTNQLKPSWWQRGILLISWALMVTALAKPTLLGEVQTRQLMGRDVMVLLDLSGSMAEQDFARQQGRVEEHGGSYQTDNKISRLDAAKQVLSEFAKSRQGDRLGLILFGDAAFVQTPFTADLQAWLALLDQTEVAMAGQSTFLGDAMGLAIKVYQQQPKTGNEEASEKVVIVLTDGNDTGSFVEPIDAAKVAAALGVKIHMIAMGDQATVGESAIDMETVERVAALTGGESFQALDSAELASAYQVINELEPKLYQSTSYQPRKDVHYYPMLLIVALYLVAFSIATTARVLKGRAISRHANQEPNDD